MPNQIQPVGQKLLVRPISETEETVNGIILPGVNNADLERGEIAAVSDELLSRNPCPYAVGEVVLYYGKRAIGVIHDGVAHVIIDGGNGLEQGDVLAILK